MAEGNRPASRVLLLEMNGRPDTLVLVRTRPRIECPSDAK